MDNEQRTSTINVNAEGGSLASGKNTVTIDQPRGCSYRKSPVCQSDHLIHKWCSQPILNRRLHSGDLVFAAGILLSGNNNQKISDFAKFIKLPILCNSSYLKIQRTYLVPSIGSFWAQSQDIVLQEFQDKEIVILVSGDYSGDPSPSGVTIESSGANVTVADQTAVLINYRSPEEAQSPTTDNVLSPDQSSLPSPVSVTGGTSSSGDTNLHFFVREQGKYIQIGQCCVIVEIHVNDQTMERLRAQGTLEVESQICASLVTLRWRGIEVDEAELRTKFKVQLTEKLLDLERAIPQNLMANQCDKCQQLVTFLLKEFRGYLTDISLGCIQLTLFFSNREDLQRGRSPEAISKIQKFLNGLLLTHRVKEGFRVTVLEKYDEVADPMDTTVYSRVQEKTTFSENLAEPGNLAIGQSGEIMTQDQFTRQISLQVKQSITEELDLFRQEQAQILRDAMKEVLPEMEQRILVNISTKLDAGKETTTLESDSGSTKLDAGKETTTSESDSGSTKLDVGKETTTSESDSGSEKLSPGFPIQMSSRWRTPLSQTCKVAEPETVDRKQTTGFLPIKPSVGKKLYTKKSHGDSWKQTPDLAICSSWSEGSHSESSENLSGDEEISDLVNFVQSKVKKPHPEVKVKQRSQPLDFSHLFNAIHGRRTEKKMEKCEECLEPKITELHKYLKEIWGENSMKVVQQASHIAKKVTRPLDDAEISEKFCTVLCVDLSHSMAGQPIKDQATLAAKIIQECLGHIGLVSIGTETKVEQELTKDKDTALKVIGQLQIEPYGHGSSSPMLQGLFTALKLLQGRVRPTDYGPHHTMYPKVVIISDGLFNDCSPDLEGKQPCQKTDELLKSVLEVMVAMDIKMPIYFVPVGKKQDVTHGWFSKLSVVEDVEVLSDSEVIEMSIGRAMNAIMWPTEPEAPYDSWQAVKKEFTRNHSATMLKQIDWFITEHLKHPPPIGTRVWMVDFTSDEKNGFYGTVLCHIQDKEVLVVMDHTGEIITYFWSLDQKRIMLYKSPKAYYTSGFSFGTLVRRGKERSYGDLGVVIRKKRAIHRVLKDQESKTEDCVILEVCWRSKLSTGDCLQVHNESEVTPAESPLLDLTGLTASKTLALRFSHDVRKNKDLGEISHSRSLASKTSQQKDTREGKTAYKEVEKF